MFSAKTSLLVWGTWVTVQHKCITNTITFQVYNINVYSLSCNARFNWVTNNNNPMWLAQRYSICSPKKWRASVPKSWQNADSQVFFHSISKLFYCSWCKIQFKWAFSTQCAFHRSQHHQVWSRQESPTMAARSSDRPAAIDTVDVTKFTTNGWYSNKTAISGHMVTEYFSRAVKKSSVIQKFKEPHYLFCVATQSLPTQPGKVCVSKGCVSESSVLQWTVSVTV